jgi:hypothetical protein
MDSKTGLEWQFKSPGKMTWYQAQQYAASLSLEGKKGWRLPTLAELESLLDRTKPVRMEDPSCERMFLFEMNGPTGHRQPMVPIQGVHGSFSLMEAISSAIINGIPIMFVAYADNPLFGS